MTNSDKGDIEGATAKIEYELGLIFVLFKIFVLHRYEECSRDRLFKYVVAIQACQVAGI